MWTQKARARNVYLRSILPNISPVNLDEYAKQDYVEIPPIFCERFPICEPDVKNMYLFQYSYGRLGLINVIRALTLKCNAQCLQKLATLMHNPLTFTTALNHFDIVRKLKNIFLRILKVEGRDEEKKVFLEIFRIIASRPDGAFKMFCQKTLIATLYRLIAEESNLRNDVAVVLSGFTQHPRVANQIVNSEYFCTLTGLLRVVNSTWEISELYPHLFHIIELDPAKCMVNCYFEMIYPRIFVEGANRRHILKCLALLLRCEEGQQMFDNCDYIRDIVEIIKSDDESLYEPGLMCLMNCTLSMYTIRRSREFWDLPFLLLKMAYHKKNAHIQLFALQVFRHIVAMPSVKLYVRRMCGIQICSIHNRKNYVEKAKENLLALIKKKPYINICTDMQPIASVSFCDIPQSTRLEKEESTSSSTTSEI